MMAFTISIMYVTSWNPSISIAETKFETGKVLFNKNCAFCHVGGGNLLPFSQDKTLFKEALFKNGFKSKVDIANLIIKGKGAMPAFGEFTSPKGNLMPARLNSEDVEVVTNYVFEQSETGWKDK
jgi:cytochrome c6